MSADGNDIPSLFFRMKRSQSSRSRLVVKSKRPAKRNTPVKRKSASKARHSAAKRACGENEENNENPQELNAIKKKVENRVDSFFKTAESSDDDDDIILVKPVERLSAATYVLGTDDDSLPHPSTRSSCDDQQAETSDRFRTTQSQDDDVMSLVDSILAQNSGPSTSTVAQPPLKDLKSLDDYRKETEDLLKSVLTSFDDLKSTAKKVEEAPKPALNVTSPKTVPIGSCPVCLDPLNSKPAVSTVCGHLFCKECILLIVKTQKRCPTCRKPINNKKYHSIFL